MSQCCAYFTQDSLSDQFAPDEMRAQQLEVCSVEHSQQSVGQWSARDHAGSSSAFGGTSAPRILVARQKEYILMVVLLSIYLLEGRQLVALAAEIRTARRFVHAPGEPVLCRQPGMSGKGAFMSRKRAIDGRHCIRMSFGRPPVRTTFFSRRFFSAVSSCLAPLRGLAVDPALIPFACCARPTVRAVITISMQAKGERRAPWCND